MMAIVKEIIRKEADGSISFGDYTLPKKSKIEDFSYEGAIYKAKTFKEVTKLKRNEILVFESEPGTAVQSFKKTEDAVVFSVEGPDDAEITLALDPETPYRVTLSGEELGVITTNPGGKLTFSVELEAGKEVAVSCVKADKE